MAQQIRKKYLSSEVINYFDDQIDAVEASVAQEIIDRAAAVAQEAMDRSAEIADEAVLRAAADDAISQDIISESNSRVSGDAATLVSANDYTDIQVASEATARSSADSVLQSQIDAISGGGSGSLSALQAELDFTQSAAGLNVDGTYDAPVGSNYLSTATSLKSADSFLDIAIKNASDIINQEIIDRAAADASIQSQITFLTSNLDPTSLDSLTEIVSAFQTADATLNGAITSLSTGLSADIDTEEAARIAADNALSARVGVLESVVWFKQKFAISNGQTSVTLSHIPESGSMSAFVDSLAIHEGAAEDYTISGTVVTFLNGLVSPGQTALSSGDTIYVKYQYKV